MKRLFLIWGLLIAVLLSGCGSSMTRVETLKSWSFQYNEGTNDYSIFFGLSDKNDKPLSVDVDVDIRIVNDEGEEVYTGTKSVSADDYGYYTSQAAGEHRQKAEHEQNYEAKYMAGHGNALAPAVGIGH